MKEWWSGENESDEKWNKMNIDELANKRLNDVSIAAHDWKKHVLRKRCPLKLHPGRVAAKWLYSTHIFLRIAPNHGPMGLDPHPP